MTERQERVRHAGTSSSPRSWAVRRAAAGIRPVASVRPRDVPRRRRARARPAALTTAGRYRLRIRRL